MSHFWKTFSLHTYKFKSSIYKLLIFHLKCFHCSPASRLSLPRLDFSLFHPFPFTSFDQPLSFGANLLAFYTLLKYLEEPPRVQISTHESAIYFQTLVTTLATRHSFYSFSLLLFLLSPFLFHCTLYLHSPHPPLGTRWMSFCCHGLHWFKWRASPTQTQFHQ